MCHLRQKFSIEVERKGRSKFFSRFMPIDSAIPRAISIPPEKSQ